MTRTLNLRRKPRTYALLGVLIVLVATLVLIDPGRTSTGVVFGVLLIPGGLACVGYLNRLVIDRATNEVIHQRGVFVPLSTKRYALGKVQAITLSRKKTGSGDEARTTFPIRLSGIRDATVLAHGNPWFARVKAEQLARLTGLPFTNRVYGKASTRPARELDEPLVVRWIREGKRFEAPELPGDTGLQETTGPSSYAVTIAAEMPQLKYLVAVLFLLVLPAVLDIGFTEIFHTRGYRILALMFLVGGFMAMALIGRSKLSMTNTEVTFRQGYFPLKARLSIRDIEELIVASDGIMLLGDTRAVWVHWGGSKADSDYLEAVIPYQLLRLGSALNQDR